MIKKNLVIFNNIQFDAIMYSNDVMFSTKIGYYAEKIAAVNSIVYYVTTNVGSLTSQKSKESLLCRYETALRQNKFLRDRELAKYQKSIMFYLRLSLNYGVSTLLFFIRLGIKYRANFTIGMLHWHEYITTKVKSKCLF